MRCKCKALNSLWLGPIRIWGRLPGGSSADARRMEAPVALGKNFVVVFRQIRQRSVSQRNTSLAKGWGRAPSNYFGWRCSQKMGRAGFEPAKANASGFTVRPVWPLRYLPFSGKRRRLIRVHRNPRKLFSRRFSTTVFWQALPARRRAFWERVALEASPAA